MLQEFPCRAPVSFFNELGDCILACAVDANQEIELPYSRLGLCDINVEKANRVTFKLLALWLVPLDVGQARNAMSLKATAPRRPRQVQGIETVVQRQQFVPSIRPQLSPSLLRSEPLNEAPLARS